jgi:hypothetical protein
VKVDFDQLPLYYSAMKDLIVEKAMLAEEFRAAMAEQLPRLIPHFPTEEEISLGHKVFEALNKDITDENREDFHKILHWIVSFNVVRSYDNEVVWLGYGKVHGDRSICIRKNGEFSSFFKTEDDTGSGPAEDFIKLTKMDDHVLKYGPAFVFRTEEDLDKEIDSWYKARRLVNEYAAKLSAPAKTS